VDLGDLGRPMSLSELTRLCDQVTLRSLSCNLPRVTPDVAAQLRRPHALTRLVAYNGCGDDGGES